MADIEPSVLIVERAMNDTSAKHSASAAKPRLSSRSGIDSFIVMDVMRAAAEREAAGADIVHMEVGQPGTPAPRMALEAVRTSLDTDLLGYTLALGREDLRTAIAAYYKTAYGVSIAPERVVVTAGSSAGFVLGFLACFDAGDAVLLPSPGYPCYRHILTALGQRTVTIETGPANRWMPSVEDISSAVAGHPNVQGLLIASPANPTGTMIDGARLGALAAACHERGLWFISDEIYHGLTYAGAAQTALTFSDEAIVINSFSKYFSMTGWRVGWMIVPERLVSAIERLAQNLYISPPAVSQVAALGALKAIEELEANKAIYATNRALLMEELPKAGFRNIVPADGAFYLYADVSDLTDDSLAFTKQMLADAGVAATPGLDFDAARGGRFVRFSYARSTADMIEGARRLKAWRR